MKKKTLKGKGIGSVRGVRGENDLGRSSHSVVVYSGAFSQQKLPGTVPFSILWLTRYTKIIAIVIKGPYHLLGAYDTKTKSIVPICSQILFYVMQQSPLIHGGSIPRPPGDA